MKTVLRYTIGIEDEQRVRMPEGAQLLHVAVADTVPVGQRLDVWALADTIEPEQDRVIRVVGTGHPTGEAPGVHVDSVIVQYRGGRGVWHVFDGGPAQ